MDFGEARPQGIPRYGSVVEWDSPVQLPLGLASRVTNCRYTAESVATRWGFSLRMKFGAVNSSISTAAVIRYLAPDLGGSEITRLMAYTQADGNIYTSTPFQQLTVTLLSTDGVLAQANTVRSPGLNPIITQAFNRAFIVQGDLTFGRGQSWVYDPQQVTLDPLSDKPLGTPWTPNTRFRVGHVVSPSIFQTNGLPAVQGTWVSKDNGHLYRCVTQGISGAAQPVWPTGTAAQVGDNGIVWEEVIPTAGSGLADPGVALNPTATADASSPITDKATVLIALTYVSDVGESINQLSTPQGTIDTGKVLVWKNTTGGAVDLAVTLPAIPAAVAKGGPLGANGATGYRAYAFIVQGTVDATMSVDPSFYAQVTDATTSSNGPFAGGQQITLNAWPTGSSLPTVNTAAIAGLGNVDVGLRWMVVIYETRTEYETGMGATSPVPVYVSASGLRLLGQRIPIGPYNTVRRKCGFTVAGASSAGPYFFIDQDDKQSPGFNQPDVQITSTCLDDNISTTKDFNFTDTYLPGASEITQYFNRIEVPPASDVYFSKTLSAVIYTGCQGFPSGHLVSDESDPEAVRIPGSNIQVSETDGDRTVCWRELREIQVSLKENSGHAIIPNNGDASTWATKRIWGGVGPVGAKAIDIGFEGDAEYLLFAHHTGLYRFAGTAPQLVSRELQKTWKRINWEYGYLISVCVDMERKEARIMVPLDGANYRNKCITLNFYYGWEDPVIFAARSGRLVPNVNGRKWSVDDIAGNDMVSTAQRYDASHAADIDRSAALMLCGADGALYTLLEGQLWDDTYAGGRQGYLSEWVSVPGPTAGLGLMQLLGATCSGIGTGLVNVYAQDETGNATYMLSTPDRTWTLSTYETARDFGIVAVPQAMRYGIGFNNGGVAGSGFEMHTSILWLNPTFATRMG